MTKMAVLLPNVKQTKTSPDKVCLTTIKSAIVAFFLSFQNCFCGKLSQCKNGIQYSKILKTMSVCYSGTYF